jgi:hypothetical protein
MLNALILTFAEGLTLCYIYLLTYLIKWLKNPDAEYSEGVWLGVFYTVGIIISMIARNYYIFSGYVMSIRVRKAVI